MFYVPQYSNWQLFVTLIREGSEAEINIDKRTKDQRISFVGEGLDIGVDVGIPLGLGGTVFSMVYH